MGRPEVLDDDELIPDVVQASDDIGRYRPTVFGQIGGFLAQASDNAGRFRHTTEEVVLDEEPMMDFVHQANDDIGRFRIAQASDNAGRFRHTTEEVVLDEEPMMDFVQANDDIGRFRIAQASDNVGRFRPTEEFFDEEPMMASGNLGRYRQPKDEEEFQLNPTSLVVLDQNKGEKNDVVKSTTETEENGSNLSGHDESFIQHIFSSCCVKKSKTNEDKGIATKEESNYINHKNMTDDELSYLGVSVFCLMKKFIDDVRAAGLDESSKIYEIENLHHQEGVIRKASINTICPIDGKQGAAYVHVHKHKDLVGPATLMLSYTWGYEIGDIIDTVLHYCNSNSLDPKRTYIWICCLCVNQHRVVEKMKRKEVIPFDVFRKTFFNRVTHIGHILAMMAPWQRPQYLTRAWCVYELYTANSNGCDITIEMPASERQNFLSSITSRGGIDDHVNKLFKTLSDTSVANAEASVQADLDNILKLIKDGIGYVEFDVIINNLLRDWVIQLIRDAVKSKFRELKNKCNQDHALFLNQVGILFSNLGEYEAAASMFESVLAFYEEEYGSDYAGISVVLNNISLVFEHQGKLELALDNYNRVLAYDEKNNGKDHVDTALTLTNMAGILWRQQRYDDALKILNRALYIQEEKLGIHIDTANTLNTIGIILNRQEHYSEALKTHLRALKMKEKLLGKDHTSTANTVNNMGLVFKNQDKFDIALDHYNRALKVYVKVLGKDHPNTVRTRKNIALLSNQSSLR